MTEAEIFEEAIVTPRTAIVPLADLRVVRRPGWLQIITPSFRQGGFNEVAFAALADGEADAIIDATIAAYREAGIAFRWSVPPGSAPADLGERLARRGLVAHEVWAMARRLDDAIGDANGNAIGDAIDDATPATVEEVTLATLDDYTRTMAEGWRVDPAPLDVAHRAMFDDPERRFRFYLARVDGAPAATASYVAFARSAYLLGGVTLPHHRRRGLYHALVAARLADARRRGLALATSHARAATSGPLLARLGFQVVARFASYTG